MKRENPIVIVPSCGFAQLRGASRVPHDSSGGSDTVQLLQVIPEAEDFAINEENNSAADI